MANSRRPLLEPNLITNSQQCHQSIREVSSFVVRSKETIRLLGRVFVHQTGIMTDNRYASNDKQAYNRTINRANKTQHWTWLTLQLTTAPEPQQQRITQVSLLKQFQLHPFLLQVKLEAYTSVSETANVMPASDSLTWLSEREFAHDVNFRTPSTATNLQYSVSVYLNYVTVADARNGWSTKSIVNDSVQCRARCHDGTQPSKQCCIGLRINVTDAVCRATLVPSLVTHASHIRPTITVTPPCMPAA